MIFNSYLEFENKFRGDTQSILSQFSKYDPLIDSIISYFENPVFIDIGSGRGEWLQKWRHKVKDIKEIINSKEWKAFWDIMFDDPNNAPRPCKEKCGVVKGEDLRNWSEMEEYHYDRPGQPMTKKDNNKGYVGS